MEGWSYLCRWHFYLAKLLRHKIAYGKPIRNPADNESNYHCDWHGKCKCKPYREVFPLSNELLEIIKASQRRDGESDQ